MAEKTNSARKQPRRVVVVLYDGVVPFDATVACEVFERAQGPDGRAAYRVTVCGVTPTVHARAFDLRTKRGLGALRAAELIVLPGVDDISTPIAPKLMTAVRAAAARGARVMSICTGAFVLAATGLLDGKRATTHWAAAEALARRFPSIRVEPDVLYVDEGSVLTSAGAAAGLDLCLHVVRRDCGASVAAQAARSAVMPLERHGGQAQFIVDAPSQDAGSLQSLLLWAQKKVAEPLTVATLARQAGMSSRTLARNFKAQVGETPARWVARLRVRRAQVLLEKTRQPVERIAEEVGFGSQAAFRAQFRAIVGTSPAAYRRAYRR